jgi:transcriptional regulator GlxA family with amidase domain
MSVSAEVHISSLPQEPSGSRENHDEWRVSAVLNHIAGQSIAKVSNIASIANSLNISPSRLRRIFKQKIGVPFGRYLKQARLHQARRLLQETHLSVKQARIEVGIFDHSHFARDYKKEFGESPSDTRRSPTAAKTVVISDAPLNGRFSSVKRQSTLAG